MSWLRDRLKPPSSWDSFKRGTLAPAVRVGGTALGAMLGGPVGGAIGGALGGIGGDAVAGENLRRSTTLRSVGGDAIGGALAGYAAQAGPLAKLLGKVPGVPDVSVDLPIDPLNPSAGVAAQRIGTQGGKALAASSLVGAGGNAAAKGGALSTLKDVMGVVGPVAQTALGYGQMQQQQRIAQEGLDFLRSNYRDRDAFRRQALALMQAGAPDTSVLIDDPTFRRAR